MRLRKGAKLSWQEENKKERFSMMKANDLNHKTADKAAVSKEAVNEKAGQMKSASAKMKPVTEKAKAPAKKTANKAVAGKKAITVKAEQTKSDSAQKKPVTGEAKTPAEKLADNAGKLKSEIAEKMDSVRSNAAVAGQKIADVAKDANKKSESFEAAVVSSLHELKKGIHWAAENIAEKTKE